MYKNASLYPELQHHACSHSQEKMCVSSPGPYTMDVPIMRG